MGRPAKEPKEKLTEVPCKVSPEVEAEIGRIAQTTDRSRSQIARKLISRGLAAYYRDGSLEELVEQPIPVKSSEKPLPTKMTASIYEPKKGGRK